MEADGARSQSMMFGVASLLERNHDTMWKSLCTVDGGFLPPVISGARNSHSPGEKRGRQSERSIGQTLLPVSSLTTLSLPNLSRLLMYGVAELR